MAPPDRRANYVYIPTYSASQQPPASSVPPSASPSRPYVHIPAVSVPQSPSISPMPYVHAPASSVPPSSSASRPYVHIPVTTVPRPAHQPFVSPLSTPRHTASSARPARWHHGPGDAPSSSSSPSHPRESSHPAWHDIYPDVIAAHPPPASSSSSSSTAPSQRSINQARSRHSASLLVVLLPPRCIAFILGLPAPHADLLALDPPRRRTHLVRAAAAFSRFSHGTIDDARRAWLRLRRFLISHDHADMWDDIPGLLIGDFFDDARSAAASRSPSSRSPGGLRNLVPVTALPPGHSVVPGLRGDLTFLATHAGLTLHLDAPSAYVAPQPAPPRVDPPALTIQAVFALQDAADDPSGSVYVRHAAAAFILMAASSLRFEQLQDCDVADAPSTTFDMVAGVTRPKRADGSGTNEEYFWFASNGFALLPSKWRAAHATGLVGLPATARFQLRAWNGRDIYSATSWRNGPATAADALRALRAIISSHLGDGAGDPFDLRSPRHFLVEVAQRRLEPPVRSVEIGRWSASQSGGTPPSSSPQALADRVGRFPRLYGATGAAAFACEVIRSQVTAVCAVTPTATRIASILLEIRTALGTGVLHPSSASRLAGRLNFLLSTVFGRIGRAPARHIYSHASRTSHAVSTGLRSAFLFLEQLLPGVASSSPVAVPLAASTPARRALIFTDACSPDGYRGVAAVHFPPGGATPTYTSASDFHLPGFTLATIAHLECAIVVISIAMFDLRDTDDLWLFCDNTTAIGALIKGSSDDPTLNALAAAFWLLIREAGVDTFISYVPSDANVADAPSRPRVFAPVDSYATLLELGARFVEFSLPPIPTHSSFSSRPESPSSHA